MHATRIFEHAFDGVLRNRADAQLLELTENAGVTPLVLFGQFQDQTADLFGRATATALRWRPLVVLLFRPKPENLWCLRRAMGFLVVCPN